MSYNYYCTYCGRELDQDKVFFDLAPVLTGSDQKVFQILKLLVTKKELEELVNSGERRDMGYVCCSLTLAELMKYISNENNLNDPQIMSLTKEDIQQYTTEISLDVHAEEDEEEDDIFSSAGKKENEKEQDEHQEDTKKKVSDAILALEKKDQKNEDIYYTKENLKKDLSILRTVFAQTDKCCFEILLDTEPDNEGNPVLIGYKVNAGVPKHITIVDERICPYCGRPLFTHAGTAEHRSVAFIGDQKAGKTSTILALAHYAQNAVQGVMLDDEIWHASQSIESVAMIELLSPSERLLADLRRYKEGIAPGKTHANQRDDAYSATFRIRNKYTPKHYLLTLTDLPGELCDPNTGKIRGNDILNHFPVALACDAFVLCFDTETAVGGNANKMISNACSWANAFEELRESYNRASGKDKGLHSLIPRGNTATGLYAPVILCFTKSPDLEETQNHSEKPGVKGKFDLIARTYVFDDERSILNRNQVYSRIGELMSQYVFLKNAYSARLRCSPYGFAAPSEVAVKENASLQLDENGNIRRPKPKHIDLLMQWLLKTSGCIPVDAMYHPSLDSNSKTVFHPHPNLITHTQYRSLPPRGTGKNADVNEALARCYLFENPGYFDKQYLLYYSQNAILTKERIMTKFRRN